MKYFLISAVILLLGCSMPGVGDLKERVDELEITAAYDDSDVNERIDEVKGDVEILDVRITAIESGGVSDITIPDREDRPDREIPEVETPEVEEVILTIADIEGLQDSIDVMKAGLSDSIAVLDESFGNMTLSMDSLILENDSLKIELEDLQDQISSLSYTVENMRYSGTESTSSRGGASGTGGRGGTTSSTGGRGGSTTTSGGSSGSGTR